MPPKPVAKGGAAKGAAVKGATKTQVKPAATKGAAGAKGGAKTTTAAKDATKQADVKKAEQDMAKMTIKKVLVPEEIGLKEAASLLNLSGDIGEKVKKSERWIFITDRNGNVLTFFKYRDVNMISMTSLDFHTEPVRKALMGALRFGKPHIIDAGDTDQTKVMDILRDRYNEIYPGLWDDLMNRSILEADNYGKLFQANDEKEYENRWDYRVADFQFMIYTNTDPPSCANDSFFPVIVN